jgi:hypothetical protein
MRASWRWLMVVGLLTLLGLALPAGNVGAQSYSFVVPELIMQVYVQPDASARIEYEITFENGRGAKAIDIVDIGLPHANYNIANMKASLNGEQLTVIRPSEYVKPGVEIHLRGQSIPAGQRGTLRFEFTMPEMVYQDTTRADYASLQITPTWFDRELVRGSGDIWVIVHMLPGIQAEEIFYQNVPFTEKALFQEQVAAIFHKKGAASAPFLVGVSFPQRGLNRVVTLTLYQLAVKWLEDNVGTHLMLGIVAFLLLTFLFFRFSGGTGITVYLLLAAGLIGILIVETGAIFLALPLLLMGIGANEYHLAGRKSTYLPAIAHTESGGIKRGLTAPEAAVLLEMPLNKVLMLVIYGLLKKGVIQQTQADPLVVTVAAAYTSPPKADSAQGRHEARLRAAQENGVALHIYEHPFLDILEDQPDRPVHQHQLNQPMKALITHVAGRMSGFSLRQSRQYYRKIISRALREANSIGELPEWEKTVDRNMEWILMSDDYRTVLQRPGRHYQPTWIRPIVTGGGATVTGGGATAVTRPAPPTSAGGRTTFGDVAASFVGLTENTMGNLASAISPGALQLPAAPGGVINLSGVDRLTGEILKSIAENSGNSGGGSGGSGSCACAGCACACACAGGGR